MGFVPAHGQRAPAATTRAVAGRVVDAADGLPLRNVQVTVHPAGMPTTAAGGLTDGSGRFVVSGLAAGSYRVAIRLLGYAIVERALTVQAAASSAAVDLGTVALPPAAIAIQEVTVTAAPEAVIFAPDRDIYSVEAMAAAAGGTATDALGQVPELEVDINGEVTLRGNSPTIFINGRPAPMSGESLTVFLQQFPADNIQSIEVMPNPSARYAAEGAGGIVNIVLKRGVRLGLTGNVFVNGGSRGELGTGARVTYQAGDLAVQAGTSARFTRTETSTAELRENLLADPITLLEQETISDRGGNSGNLDFEIEYSLAERTRLTVQSRIDGSIADADRLTSYTEMTADRTVTDEYDRVAVDDSRDLSTDLAFELQHEFDDRGHELDLEVDYQRGRDLQESLIRQRLIDELLEEDPTIELTLDDQSEHQDETGVRIDYARPFGERSQVEIGYQGEMGETIDGQLRSIGQEGMPPGEMVVSDRGFAQRQTVHSAYLTGMRRFGRLDAQIGVRAERTDDRYRLNANGLSFGGEYLSLFPNSHLTYRMGEGVRLRAAYSMRVRRPSANILNPTNRSTDPLNRRVGNPDIEPQYTHSFSLDASWRKGPASVRVSPFYQRSVDEFTQYKTVDELGVSTTTWENLASSASYGTTVSLALRGLRRLDGSVNLNARREERDGSFLSDRSRRSSTRWSLRTNLDARLTATLSLQGTMNYNPPRELTQGRASATVMTSTALRKRMMDGRASLNLSVTDPLDIYRPATTTVDRGFRESGRERVSVRRGSLSVSYAFGGRGRGGGERRGERRGD